MKKTLILIIGISLSLLLTCDKSNGDPDPTCSDGIQNGNETGVDCGGDCSPCFDCMTNYCSLLTGATSDQSNSDTKWISVSVQGNPDDGSWKITFNNQGLFLDNYEDEGSSGNWEFDDPNNPTKITLDYSVAPSGWPDPRDIALLRLDADTLGLHSGTWIYYFIQE